MIKVFISQPMRGLTDDEILLTRREILENVEKIMGEPVEEVKSFFEDFNPEGNIPLAYLGKSISLLATADLAYFGEGWKDARGCRIEHECAVRYGIAIIKDDYIMNFGQALEALKQGKKVARKGWNGKSQYIELATNISYVNSRDEVVNVEHDAMGNKAIAFVGTSGVQLGWLASQADMLSEDWVIVK